MEIYKTAPSYTLQLTQLEAESLSRDLHRWYVHVCVNDEHIEEINAELAEGECEFGVIFMVDLQKVIDEKP